MLYYAGKVDWWLIREKPVTGIEVNFALNAGIEGAKYNDFAYVLGSTYDGYLGGFVGFQANVNFRLPNKWALQPMFINTFGVGNETSTKLVSGGASIETNESYYGIYSTLGCTLSKKMDSGNSLIFSFTHSSSNYNSGNSFDIGVGYVIAL